MWCTEAIEKARVQRQKHPGRPYYQNEPELVRLALKQMRDLGLTAISSDKDSGFVLMKLSDISALHEEILVEKGYNEITLHDINLVSMKGSRSSKKNLSLIIRGSEWRRSQLQTNLKTHTPPGQVKPRAIHAATKNPLVPLGNYAAWKLRKVLSRETHILNSAEEFHSRIEGVEHDQEDRLITADVKDFFEVGDHRYLARMAASILKPKDRNLKERVILFLLRNQSVTSTLCESGGIFQVEQGSGIGFVASGEIGDSVFLAVMERQYILEQEVRPERRIKA